MAGREVEGQGGQRVHHAKAAGVATIDGFHADDADDDFSRYAVFFLGAIQCLLVFQPEAPAGLNAHRVDEAAAVDAPVLDESLGGRLHQPYHGGVVTRLADRIAHPVGVQVAACSHVVGKLHGFGAGRIQRTLRRR
jgi:hypothetical protein